MYRALKSTFLASPLVLSVFLVFSVISIFPASSASAQGIPGIGEPITLSMDPAHPKPLETVTLSLQSYSVNVDQATITWLSGGKVIGKGIGLKQISVQAGSLGTSKTIEADVVTREAGQLSVSTTIRPAELTLIWQAASYVPPFYKGKALLPYGGSYKVVALPEMINAAGRRVDPKTLLYSWSKNGASDQASSGYGKDFFVSSQSSFVRHGDDISVEVTNPADGFTATQTVTIAPQAPEIRFYENSPLYGTVLERELGNTVALSDEEISIDAEPFYFSVLDKRSSLLSYSWSLNGSNILDFQGKNTITLRRTDKNAGSSEIGLAVGNSAQLLQGADHSLVIRYE